MLANKRSCLDGAHRFFVSIPHGSGKECGLLRASVDRVLLIA